MDKIKYRNRFRVRDSKGNILYLNSILNSKGEYQFVQGFEELQDAQDARDNWAALHNKSTDEFPIESYSENTPHLVKKLSKRADSIVKRMHLFSGKGLKHNTLTRPRDENKYKPDKFYGRETWMFQSMERAKGTSLVSKLGDKKSHSNQGGIPFERIEKTVNDSTFDLSFNLIESLRKHNFPNRKALKDYLKSRSFSNRQINAIIPKYYYK